MPPPTPVDTTSPWKSVLADRSADPALGQGQGPCIVVTLVGSPVEASQLLGKRERPPRRDVQR